MLRIKNEHFENFSRIFKDAGKYSRTTRCFSRIKDITSFDSKFKDNSWRSRSSGNLTHAQWRTQKISEGGQSFLNDHKIYMFPGNTQTNSKFIKTFQGIA